MTAVWVLFIVIFVAVTIYRLRRGGPGPSVQWIPRGLRGWTNSLYERRGWTPPYDEDGDRSSDRPLL